MTRISETTIRKLLGGLWRDNDAFTKPVDQQLDDLWTEMRVNCQYVEKGTSIIHHAAHADPDMKIEFDGRDGYWCVAYEDLALLLGYWYTEEAQVYNPEWGVQFPMLENGEIIIFNNPS